MSDFLTMAELQKMTLKQIYGLRVNLRFRIMVR